MKKLLFSLFSIFCLFYTVPCNGESPLDEKPIYGSNQEQVKREFSQERGWSQEEMASHRAFRKRCEQLEELSKKIKIGVTSEKKLLNGLAI